MRVAALHVDNGARAVLHLLHDALVLAATTPTLKALSLSNDTSVPIPAYSTKYGQAVAPTAAGNWTAVGGNLKRNYYEQFTVAATGSESSDVRGGTGPGVTSTAYGSFAAPLLLPNQTGSPTNIYHLVLNGTTGVSLTAGQTLTIRLHWACSSTGTPRHALLKNVVVKGTAQVVTATATSPALAAAQLCPNPTPASPWRCPPAAKPCSSASTMP